MVPPLVRSGYLDALRAGGEAKEREEGDRLGEHEGRPREDEGTRRRPRDDADDRSLALEAFAAFGASKLTVGGEDDFRPGAVGGAALLLSRDVTQDPPCPSPPHEALGLTYRGSRGCALERPVGAMYVDRSWLETTTDGEEEHGFCTGAFF